MKIAWYYKVLFVAIIAVAIFLWGRGCGIHAVTKEVRTDTVIVKGKTDTTYIPVPSTVTNTFYVPKFIHTTDTLETFETVTQKVDTANILKRYFETVTYKDVQNVKRGTVTIFDTVTQNRIIKRRLQTDMADTIITKTVTLIPPHKNVLYFGLSGFGNKNDLLFGAGADLSLKDKTDRIYSLGTKYLKGGNWYVEGQIKFPIKLKK